MAKQIKPTVGNKSVTYSLLKRRNFVFKIIFSKNFHFVQLQLLLLYKFSFFFILTNRNKDFSHFSLCKFMYTHIYLHTNTLSLIPNTKEYNLYLNIKFLFLFSAFPFLFSRFSSHSTFDLTSYAPWYRISLRLLFDNAYNNKKQ